jgi:hypothetical protein
MEQDQQLHPQLTGPAMRQRQQAGGVMGGVGGTRSLHVAIIHMHTHRRIGSGVVSTMGWGL